VRRHLDFQRALLAESGPTSQLKQSNLGAEAIQAVRFSQSTGANHELADACSIFRKSAKVKIGEID
jgi:hypothetical protein